MVIKETKETNKGKISLIKLKTNNDKSIYKITKRSYIQNTDETKFENSLHNATKVYYEFLIDLNYGKIN